MWRKNVSCPNMEVMLAVLWPSYEKRYTTLPKMNQSATHAAASALLDTTVPMSASPINVLLCHIDEASLLPPPRKPLNTFDQRSILPLTFPKPFAHSVQPCLAARGGTGSYMLLRPSQ